jgi:excisionase family DNA binding protein
MKQPESDILTITEVAEFLKVAERTIYRLAAAKKIPAFKVGGTWRFSRGEIDAWIKQQSSDVSEAGGKHNNDNAPRGRSTKKT